MPEASNNPTDTTTVIDGRAPSLWLRYNAAARLAEFDRVAQFAKSPATHVVLPLGTVAARPGTREDRACDRCRIYRPDGLHIVTLSHPWRRVTVTGGLCDDCAALEGVLP